MSPRRPIARQSAPFCGRALGRHVQHLRKARGWTQEVLAERSDLSPDTIRRLERGVLAPNIDTLVRICTGLNLVLSTFFAALELPLDSDVTREMADLLRTRSPREQTLAMTMLHALFDNLDDLGDDELIPDKPTD